MVIQIEVTLQPDYTCDGEGHLALQKLLFYYLATITHILSSTIVNSCSVNVLSARWHHWLSLVIIIQASASGFVNDLFSLLAPHALIERVGLAVASSKFRQRQYFLIQFTEIRTCFIITVTRTGFLTY